MTTNLNSAKQTMIILFWLCKHRAKSGKPTIYVRIIIDSKRAHISTHQNVSPKFWNAKTQCVRETADSAEAINKQLLFIKAELQQHYDRLVALDQTITPEILKNCFLGIGGKERTFQELYES